jgi:hypothetical protein
MSIWLYDGYMTVSSVVLLGDAYITVISTMYSNTR